MNYNCKSKIFAALTLLLSTNTVAQSDTIQPANVMTDKIKIENTLLTSRHPLSDSTFTIDKRYALAINTDNFKLNTASINIYDMPYSRTANYPNYGRLGLNTGVLFGAGVLTLGVLYLLPENATAWNKEEAMKTPLFERWWKNVKKGPVVDKDNFVFNYILHPYGGAAYFMSARSQGFNMWYSALYCAGISTIFWEYGIEAFMEIPSIQDLIITPLVGSVFGEAFYILKRHIVANDHHLWGSKILGNIVVYLIDPVNEVIGVVAGNPTRKKKGSNNISFTCTPFFNPLSKQSTVGLNLALRF